MRRPEDTSSDDSLSQTPRVVLNIFVCAVGLAAGGVFGNWAGMLYGPDGPRIGLWAGAVSGLGAALFWLWGFKKHEGARWEFGRGVLSGGRAGVFSAAVTHLVLWLTCGNEMHEVPLVWVVGVGVLIGGIVGLVAGIICSVGGYIATGR